MTDAELTRALAEKVMGWVVVGPQLNRRTHYDFSGDEVYVDEAGCFWRGTKPDGNAAVPWRPLEAMGDAMQVVDCLIATYDCAFLLDYDYNHTGQWHAGFGIASDEFPDAVSDTPQRAIALAALKAHGMEVTP